METSILIKDMEEIYSRKLPWHMFSETTVLVSGAYGMLASYLIYFLLFLSTQKNIPIHIIVVVRSREKFLKRFTNTKGLENVDIIESNLETQLIVNGKIDYIIHAASLASPQYYSVCPIDVLLPNTIGNKILLDLAVEKGVKGYLLFSTGDVYGKVIGKDRIAENDYGVMDTLDIHNCYSESKRMAETMCKAYFQQKGVPIKIVRIWHTYAPTMDVENDPRVFASFIGDVLHNRDIVMMSDGTTKRSFCYITDAIAGYFTVLFYGKIGEAYNVCNSDQFLSIAELAEKIINIYPEKNLHVIKKKRDEKSSYTENILASEAVPDNTKLKELEWNSYVNVEKGFKRVIDFYEKSI